MQPLLSVLLLALAGQASSHNHQHEDTLATIEPKTIVDLSHPLNNDTIHWPKNTGFQYESLIDKEVTNHRNESYYLRSDAFKMAIHTGTHLDAPRHFSKDGWTVDMIPLERLVEVPLHVVDLSTKVKANRTYSFVKSDFVDSKTNKSLVGPNSVVIVYTGLSELYSQGVKAYIGTDTGKMYEMKIPGFSKEAAQFLVDAKVYGVGLDAPSADSSDQHGADETLDPVAHKMFNSNNIYILENVSNKLKAVLMQNTKWSLTIAPLPITNGSGSPIRLLAMPATHEHHEIPSAASSLLASYPPNIHVAIIIALLSLVAVDLTSIGI